MKILLVRPPRMEKSITLGEFMYCEPLGLEVVYTLIKDMCDVILFDMMADKRSLLELLIDEKPDFVGFTTLCVDVQSTLSLCRVVKSYNENIITAVGGTQSFFNPEAFFTEHIDHVFKYTDENNFRLLLKQIMAREYTLIDGVLSRVLKFQNSGVPGRNIYIHPDVSCSLQYRKKYSYLGYNPCAIMQTSTGCSSKCLFCMRWRLEGGSEKDLPLDGVVKHIQSVPEDHVMIIDNDFLNNAARLTSFCDLLEKYKIKKQFICYASVRGVLANGFQMGRLAENGLKTFLVGYETFSEKEMDFYKKESSPESSFKAASILKEHGIDCWASFILHPDWTGEDFKDLRSYIKALAPEVSTFSPLTPFPGLPLYTLYKDRLLFTKENYGKWSFGEVTVSPLKMSLKRYYYEILKTILYINFVINKPDYMVRRFGLKTLLGISKGSIKVFIRYIGLMLRSDG